MKLRKKSQLDLDMYGKKRSYLDSIFSATATTHIGIFKT